MSQLLGNPNRALPTSIVDNYVTGVRSGIYGGVAINEIGNGLISLAEEGNYFTAVSSLANFQTAVVYQATSVFDATKAYTVIYNGNTTKNLFMDYIRIRPSAIPANETALRFAIAIDDINRVVSDGTVYVSFNNNEASSTTSGAVITFGAITLAAAHNPRYIATSFMHNGKASSICDLTIKFGVAKKSASVMSNLAIGNNSMCVNVGPAIIGPGHSLLFHLWEIGDAVNIPSYISSCGWWEK